MFGRKKFVVMNDIISSLSTKDSLRVFYKPQRCGFFYASNPNPCRFSKPTRIFKKCNISKKKLLLNF